MSVEEYLKAQCDSRVQALKRHMEGLVEEFDAEAKRARGMLRDIANSCTTTVDDPSCDAGEGEYEEDKLCDPFALVAIQGCHAGRTFLIEPTATKKVWKVGRTEDNDICLAGDDEVSSGHAQISFDRKQQQFKLQDTGSTNGSYATKGPGQTVKLKKRVNHTLKVDNLV